MLQRPNVHHRVWMQPQWRGKQPGCSLLVWSLEEASLAFSFICLPHIHFPIPWQLSFPAFQTNAWVMNSVHLIMLVILYLKFFFTFGRTGLWSGCGRYSWKQATCESEWQWDSHLSQLWEWPFSPEGSNQLGNLCGVHFLSGALTF